MRGLMRNKRPIYYSNFSKIEYEEKDGKKTGHKKVVYQNVQIAYGTVSAPSGSTSLEMFGTDEDYDKTIVLDMPTIDINENTVLWVDKPYTEGTSYDYIVRRVIRNINYMFIGIRKVNVQKEQPTPTPTPVESDTDEDSSETE